MRGISECVAGLCPSGDQLLERISHETEGKTLAEKVRIVNSMVNNGLRYRTDQSLYGKLDYWATPSEILARAGGDCEDFAILKMTALIGAGVPASSLSLVVLRVSGRGTLHAILAVATSSGNFILDNAQTKVSVDGEIRNFKPLYSLSENRAWIYGVRVSSPVVAENSDLSTTARRAEAPAGRLISHHTVDFSLQPGRAALN